MNEQVKKLADEASKLSPDERAELVEGILTTLDQPDPQIDALWLQECERRMEAFDRGEITAIDAKEVLAKYLKP